MRLVVIAAVAVGGIKAIFLHPIGVRNNRLVVPMYDSHSIIGDNSNNPDRHTTWEEAWECKFMTVNGMLCPFPIRILHHMTTVTTTLTLLPTGTPFNIQLESNYDTLVSSYSDANMLAMFVADHPFHARAALQLAMVFYRTGNVDRGTEMLRRAMCVLEHACLPGFLPTITTTSHHNHVSHNRNLMDRDRPENEPFFLALFRWIQTSCMVG